MHKHAWPYICRYTKYTHMHICTYVCMYSISSLPPCYIYKVGRLMDSLACVAAPAQQLPLRGPWKKQGAWFGQADSKIFQEKKASRSMVSIQNFRLVENLSSSMNLIKLNMRDTAMVIFCHTLILRGLVTRNKAVRNEGRQANKTIVVYWTEGLDTQNRKEWLLL